MDHIFFLQLGSQHPYAEQFIGEPYVYTLNKDDPEEVRTTVQKIIDANHVRYSIFSTHLCRMDLLSGVVLDCICLLPYFEYPYQLD